MLKIAILVSAFIIGSYAQVFAAPLTSENIIGRYDVEASVAFKKVKIHFRVLSQKEFEIERLERDGTPEETCNGTYTLNPHLFWQDAITLAQGRFFKGVFTCPSNRSREVDFNIDFQNRTTEDLVRGTTVIVTSSILPMRIKATVKRVD